MCSYFPWKDSCSLIHDRAFVDIAKSWRTQAKHRYGSGMPSEAVGEVFEVICDFARCYIARARAFDTDWRFVALVRS
jgi:hypothetical protein